MDTADSAPAWFEQAVSSTPKSHFLEVMEQRIHCQVWESESGNAQGLLFVHGHAAHAHWWDFIAPSFQRKYRVGAMDMSGNGDSAHRDKYTAGQFAAEISQVAEWLSPNTIVVAHSFGAPWRGSLHIIIQEPFTRWSWLIPSFPLLGGKRKYLIP